MTSKKVPAAVLKGTSYSETSLSTWLRVRIVFMLYVFVWVSFSLMFFPFLFYRTDVVAYVDVWSASKTENYSDPFIQQLRDMGAQVRAEKTLPNVAVIHMKLLNQLI